MVEGLAPGETIKAVRFTTDRCYLVTNAFVQTDPLFDLRTGCSSFLSRRRFRKVLGELKIPGFSSYLHRAPVSAPSARWRDAPESGLPRT